MHTMYGLSRLHGCALRSADEIGTSLYAVFGLAGWPHADATDAMMCLELLGEAGRLLPARFMAR